MIGLAYGASGNGDLKGHAFGTNPDGVAPERDVHYNITREKLLSIEKDRRFDADALEHMTPLEIRAHGVAELVQRFDDYGSIPDVPNVNGIYNSKAVPRIYKGAPFLAKIRLINGPPGARMLPIAQRMPKGAHLHVHFDACLDPDYLLKLAVNFPAMHIRSHIHLLTPDNCDNCEIQFEVRPTAEFNAKNCKQLLIFYLHKLG